MTTPEVSKCSDGHFRHIIYGLGPYIKNKYCWAVLSKDGVSSKSKFPHLHESLLFILQIQNRCTADWKNIDGGGVQQSHEHTQLLMDTFGVKALWDDHGIVADILVSQF